jgi:hypothetical protein
VDGFDDDELSGPTFSHDERGRDRRFDLDVEAAPTGPRAVGRKRRGQDLPAPRSDRFEAETEEPNPQSGMRAPTPWLLLGSIAVAVIWLVGAGLNLPGGDLGLVELVQLLAPAAFAILAGAMGDSLVRSNRGSRSLTVAAQRMLSPDRMGEKSARSTAGAVRDEIRRLESALGEVTSRLAQIENKVDEKASALRAAGETARGGAEALVATMEGERERLDSLLTALSELTNTAQRTTRTASEGIDERARALAVASETLLDRTEQASELARSAAVRLEQASQRAMDAISQLDEVSTRGEQSLARAHDMMVMARIRADEAIGAVRHSTEALQEAAGQAAGNLGALAEAVQDTGRQSNELFQQHAGISREVAMTLINDIRTAAEQSGREMVNALRAEADMARATGETTLAALRQSAETVRSITRETGDDLARTLDANAQRIDGLKLSASELDNAAQAALENRTAHARTLVQQSVGMLDETGEQIRAKFSSIADACADQARSVEDLLDTISNRLGGLPVETGRQADAIRVTLEDTLARINEAGRKALEETAVLDAGFQRRLQDSYAAMGELVGRLGGLTGVFQPPPGTSLPAASPPPAPPVAPVVQAQALPASPPPPPPPPPEPTPIQPVRTPPVQTPPVLSEPVQTSPARPEPRSAVPPVRYNLDYTLAGSRQDTPPQVSGQPAERALPDEPSQARQVPDKGGSDGLPTDRMASDAGGLAGPAGLRGRTTPDQRAPASTPPVVPGTAPEVPDGRKANSRPPQAWRTETARAEGPERAKPGPETHGSELPGDDNPFSGVNLRDIPSSRSAREVPWRWREVLSALEPDDGPLSEAQAAGLVRELDLRTIIPDARLNQMRGRATRGRDSARADAVAVAQSSVFAMRDRFAADPGLRARTLAFIEARRPLVQRGNLNGDLLRFYLIADAALD